MSKVSFKPGVEFDVIAPAGYKILWALKSTAVNLNVDLTITSGTDGDHSGPFDPHKTGEAYDVRSHDFDSGQKAAILTSVMGLLGWDHFYGFLESPGREMEHYHFQRAKGTTYTVEDLLNG